MNFAPNTRARRPAENIVPMINVVFLLLIFFLMSAQIAPPAPVDIDAPESAAEDRPQDDSVLYLSADGVAYFAGLEGPLALSALASDAPETLTLHADAALPAADLVRLLPQFGAFGIKSVELITGPRP